MARDCQQSALLRGGTQCCAWTASTISSMATSAAVGAPVELSCSAAQSHRGQGGFSVEAQVAARHQGNPDEVQAAVRRVKRLERALVILGERDSSEIRGLQAALKEARRAGSGSSSGSSSRGMPSIHTFTKEVGAFAGGTSQRKQQLDTVLACMARFREEMARTTAPGPTVGCAEADPTLTQPGKIAEFGR